LVGGGGGNFQSAAQNRIVSNGRMEIRIVWKRLELKRVVLT